jgi:hypothetical protein
MPARDHSLALRGAVKIAIAGDARVQAVVAQRVYAQQPAPEPDRPWIRTGPISVTPFQTSTEGGGDATWMVHVFADDDDVTRRLCAAIVYVLDEQTLQLDPADTPDPDADVTVFDLLWVGTDVLPDTGREGGYHGVVRFTATTAESV